MSPLIGCSADRHADRNPDADPHRRSRGGEERRSHSGADRNPHSDSGRRGVFVVMVVVGVVDVRVLSHTCEPTPRTDTIRLMIVARTARLVLRHFGAGDAAAMELVLCDPEVMRFSRGVAEPAWVPTWIEQRRSDYESLGYGVWAVVRTDDDEVIGYCGLTLFPDIDGVPEIEVGYRLRRSAWGHGYATEAAMAVRDMAFASYGFERLVAIIDPANHASLNVARKLGMTYEKDVMMDGYDHPDHLYVVEVGGAGAVA